jgi:hypothetical protein
MKKYLFRYSFVLSIILSLVNTSSIFSQEDKTPVSPDYEFKYFKDSDNNRILQTRTSYFDGIKEHSLAGLNINYYTKDKELVKLGQVTTDLKGIARLKLPADLKLTADKEGKWYFMSDFSGDTAVEAASAELLIQDINLEMTLFEQDSLKYLKIKGSRFTGKDFVPLTGESIIVAVPRMFSQLPVAEGTFDDQGNAEVEFPADIPGDDIGNIIVVAKFEDHENFGNVYKQQQIAWGIAAVHSSGQNKRELWTEIAPRWMILTLSIMLAGVWGHYIFAIISLIRIKKSDQL